MLYPFKLSLMVGLTNDELVKMLEFMGGDYFHVDESVIYQAFFIKVDRTIPKK